MIFVRVVAAILAAVLAVAAVVKLISPGETADDFASLGLRHPAALAKAVPGVELITALLLLAVPSIGGLVAFALIAAFTVVLVNVVRSGRVVSCACFGALSSQPISPLTLGRNAVLLVLAAVPALS